MDKNYGIDIGKELAEQSEKDFVFGSVSLPDLAKIPEDQRENYLPEGELQNIGEDKQGCASRGPLNILEAKFNYLVRNKIISDDNIRWLADKGYLTVRGVEFADAFVEINSGTTKKGNSMKAPLEAIRTKKDKNEVQGLVPKSLLPQLGTFKEHHYPNKYQKRTKN